MPRVSLRTLFIVTLVAAVATAYFLRPTPIERIQEVLVSDRSDREKLEFVSNWMQIGDLENEVLARLGTPSGSISGGLVQHDIWFHPCDLCLSFRSDGTLFCIGYNERVPSSPYPVFHVLASEPLDADR